MLTNEQEELVAKGNKTAFLIWIAFVASVFAYGVFVYILEFQKINISKDFDFDSQTRLILTGAISFISLGTLVVSFFWKNHIMKAETIVEKLKAGGTSRGSSSICSHLQTGMITTLAFRESVVLYGLFLYLITSNFFIYIYFALPAFFLLLELRPSMELWTEKTKEVLKLKPDAIIYAELPTKS